MMDTLPSMPPFTTADREAVVGFIRQVVSTGRVRSVSDWNTWISTEGFPVVQALLPSEPQLRTKTLLLLSALSLETNPPTDATRSFMLAGLAWAAQNLTDAEAWILDPAHAPTLPEKGHP